ncbi:G-protein coupled receptor 15-like [Heptranchias perlo]|uniref:G-protein coupled receptor 15-like n=1 Tax=Heptranchias perlo TaxID=212740 RepID=UPI003559C275
MAVANLLVVIIDLVLRQIPVRYENQFLFMYSFPVCNLHAVLLYSATDCSVWFTVAFTFDRFVAICCQKLKTKYCTDKIAAVVLGTVTALFCLKNTAWYFMLTAGYRFQNVPWFCAVRNAAVDSKIWATVEILHYILTPLLAFVLVLLLNAFTAVHISLVRRARERSHGQSSDSELEAQRKSIILLFVISGNFILLWAVFMVYSVWNRVFWMGYESIYLPRFVMELGFMLQLLSCCTQTCIYAVTQNKFREELKDVVICPFTAIVNLVH